LGSEMCIGDRFAIAQVIDTPLATHVRYVRQ